MPHKGNKIKTAVIIHAAITVFFLASGRIFADPAFSYFPQTYTASDYVTMEVFFPDGKIESVQAKKTDVFPQLKKPLKTAAVSPAAPLPPPANVISQLYNGPDSNRICIAILGDGYTNTELARYTAHATARAAAFFNEEPFASYKNYFNVYRVEVISNESGVDNDPVNGTLRDTALGMYYWCAGTDRLLCIDTTAAWSYAANAPMADVIMAFANSTTYGGAGYANLATAAGNNSLSNDVIIHESGHSYGRLADEYDASATYAGSEFNPSPSLIYRNLSIYQEAAQVSAKTKWWNWMGEADPAGGTVTTYEGGGTTYKYGVWRPTTTSRMRANGRPFNLVSSEAIILNIYNKISPVDSYTATNTVKSCGDTISITTQQPVGFDLDVYWLVDGVTQTAQTGLRSVTISSLGFINTHTLTAIITDNNPLIRDAGYKKSLCTKTLSWVFNCPPSPTATKTASPTLTITETHTVTATRTDTATHTASPTLTITPTESATFTETPFLTSTPVYSATITPSITATTAITPTAVPGGLKITDRKINIFPNPAKAGSSLYLGFGLNKNAVSLKFRLYSPGFRKIREFDVLGSYTESQNMRAVDSGFLNGLSAGMYYFTAAVSDSDGNFASSRPDAILVVK